MKRTASAQMEHWDATLARALSAGGRPLRTLRDAGLYLTDNYELLSPSLALEDAIDLLGRVTLPIRWRTFKGRVICWAIHPATMSRAG